MVLAAPLQDALAPMGPQSSRIAALFWGFSAVALVVFVLVAGFLLVAVARRRSPLLETPEAQLDSTTHRKLSRVVGGFTGATLVIVLGLLVASAMTGARLSRLNATHAVTLRVLAHQWWWEFQYTSADPGGQVVTANELHIPTGRPVVLQLGSTDVIHSFWVPALHGKTDLIPSRENTIKIQADTPGVYRGQCAEYCGYQHAHMAFWVVAEPEAQFAAWLEAQSRPAIVPADAAAKKGRDVFLSRPCVLCHTIHGTDARGIAGPDLTHVAGRTTLGAATIPNSKGHLAGWIVDSQSVKPGNNMPPLNLDPNELQALLAYLETLK
jgi:cytochrome c oxidase subunit 2